MPTWMPTAAPKLVHHCWVPPVDVDAPLDLRSVALLEAALQKRRDEARNLRVPQPMGLCIATPAAAPNQPHAHAANAPHDDRMEDVDSDAMSASDFGDMGNASMDDDLGSAAASNSTDDDADDEEDDEHLARFL